MQGQTVILRGRRQRDIAKRLIEAAPPDSVVNVRKMKRSDDQNSKMWAMLSDVSRAKPEGLEHIPEMWKSIFMKALKHEVQFAMGLDGEPFPVGFKTSVLNREQMSDLIEFMYEYGARHDVEWSEPNPYERAQ